MLNALRVLILFSLGIVLTFILIVLHFESKLNLFPNSILIFFQQIWWWVLPFCGIGAVYVGVMYPFIDHKLGECHYYDREWTSIIRCVGLFFGLNHLCAKLTFSSTYHFFLVLMIFCLLFWYWFDKTKSGLLFNIFHALIVNMSTYIFRLVGVLGLNQISSMEFSYLQTCLLWLVFSGCLTFGNIGRLLNMHSEHHEQHKHVE